MCRGHDATTGRDRPHLLLLVDPQTSPGEAEACEHRARRLFDTVVRRPFVDPDPGRRLLAFDALRAGLTTTLGLRELLYLDPDTAAFADLLTRFPDVHRFAPGSTYWNMLVRSLGPQAVRLPDEFNRTVWDVPAAGGGFALLPTALFRDSRLRWTTYGTGIAQAAMLSEHVIFRDRLRTLTGRRVVVLQDVDCVYRR